MLGAGHGNLGLAGLSCCLQGAHHLTSREPAELCAEACTLAVRSYDMTAAAIHTLIACRCKVSILRGDLDGLHTLSCNEQCPGEVRSMPARPTAQHEQQIAACLAG